jgi:hypothetical protein
MTARHLKYAALALLLSATPAMAFNGTITGPGAGDIYFYCMQNIQEKSARITDPDLRKSFLDHAAEACVAAEAKKF